MLKRILLARALFRLANDPEQTEAVFDFADKAPPDSPAKRHVLKRLMAIPEMRKLIEERYNVNNVDLQALSQLPVGSLGRTYAEHMLQNKLDPNFYRVPKRKDEISYIILRSRQTHDIWHVLTGYSTEWRDELALQAFTLAQLEAPTSAMVIAAGFLWTIGKKPDEFPKLMNGLLDGWQRGRKAKFLLAQKWEERWSEPLDQLRREMNLV